MGKDNQVNKEVRESELEKINMEFRVESYKQSIIKDINSGMGDKIKKIGSKPEILKVPLLTRIKRWFRKRMI